MAEDTVLRLVNGEPTTAYIEDVQHTYAIDAASVVAGDVVYQVSGVDSKVAKADADNAATRPPIGVCISVPTATTAVVVHSGGIVTGMSGLTRGTAYWLSTTAGALTSTKPSSNAFVIGVALSATELLICCVPADMAAGGGTITIKDDGQTINTNFTSLNFTGFATITDAGGGAATISVQGGGGTGGPSASGAINTVPTASQFSTTVLGAGSVTDTTSALVLKGNGHGASYDIQQILQTTPASPWTRYFKMEVNPLQKAYLFAGFAIKQTSSGKFTQWILISGGSDLSLEYDQMTNATTRSSFTAIGVIDPTDVYFAIEDDGANFNFYSSPTGIVGTYVLAHTVSRTAWMTDYDLIGFCVDAQNSSTPNRDCYAIIEHFSADPPTFVAGTNTAFSTLWNPKALPASPHAKDDEFSDGSFDTGKWTEFDPPSVLTVTEDSYGLKLAVSDDGGATSSIVGIRQSIPSSDEFEVVAQVTIGGPRANYMSGGIFIAGDIATNPTTAPILTLGTRIATGGQDEIGLTNWSNRTTWNAAPYAVEERNDTIFLALQWKVSTTKTCAWYSYNGVDWTRLSTTDYAPTTVSAASYFGIFADGNDQAGNVRSDMFRVREAASGIINIAPSMQGARVAVSNGARTGSGTDNRLVRWDGTQNLQDSSVSLDDSGNLTLLSAAAIKITESSSAPTTSAGVGALWLKNTTPSSFRVVNDAGTDTPLLIGPASATDNAIMRWNGTSGTAAKDSNVTISVNDIIVGAQGLTLVERGTAPTVAAGVGAYWVRNDTPSVPVFTDDTATDYHLLNWSPVKRPCRIATTANHGLSGLSAVDGVTPVAGDRILVWQQTTASANGIYVAASGSWTRAADFDEGPNDHITAGVETYIQEGSTWAGDWFYLTTTGTITIGSTSLTFKTMFPWRDLLGEITVRGSGANNPPWNTYRGTISQFQFTATTKEAWINFHIPHDWVPNSDFYIHAHWSQIVVDTGGAAGVPGSVVWKFDVSYADGHGTPGGAADPFIAPVTITVTQQGSTTQYGHMIAETQLSNNGGTGGLLNSTTISVDGAFLIRVYRESTDAGDTLNQDPFLHFCDLHYQSNNTGTKNKVPNFYT